MFESKNKKFKKYFKIKYKLGASKQYDNINYGSYGLKSLDSSYIKVEHINSVIKTVKRIVKKKNIIKLNIFPDFPVTRKPRDVRMGRGKGSPAFKVYPIKAGKIILEVLNAPENVVLRALRYCSLRLPVNTVIVKNHDKRTDNFKSSW